MVGNTKGLEFKMNMFGRKLQLLNIEDKIRDD